MLVVVSALLIDRKKRGMSATILLVLLCLTATSRYAYWRTATLWRYLHNPWGHVSPLAVALMLTLLGAEILYLRDPGVGLLPKHRTPQASSAIYARRPATWPVVDV